MAKRILNEEKPDDNSDTKKIKVEDLPKPEHKVWYRVALLRSTLGNIVFPHVVSTKESQAVVEKLSTFVRWEPAVEVEV